MICEHVTRWLDPYLDGELAAESRQEIDAHLESCAECRHSVTGREALGRLVRSAPYYAAPPGLRARVSAETTRAPSRRRFVAWAAAAVVVLAAGGGISLLRSRLPNEGDPLVNEVVTGHLRSLMADHIVDVRSEDQHTVKPWFLGKIDFAPPVVDLASLGFPLVGGRIDYLDGRPAAALVYQRRQHTINVFVLPVGGTRAAPDDVRSIRGFHVRHWTHADLSFWAVSDLSEPELAVFVRALQGS